MFPWKNHSFSHHWTETDCEVLEYLSRTFGEEAVPLTMSYSGDVKVGHRFIEIKSCREKITHKGYTTRSGQFVFGGHESKADYILFILLCSSGRMKMDIRPADQFPKLGNPFKVNWKRIFPDE